jgi:hypothetical protein
VSLGPPIGAYWLIVIQGIAMPDRHCRISVFSNGFEIVVLEVTLKLASLRGSRGRVISGSACLSTTMHACGGGDEDRDNCERITCLAGARFCRDLFWQRPYRVCSRHES